MALVVAISPFGLTAQTKQRLARDKKKQMKKMKVQSELLSLFFCQYQSHEKSFGHRAEKKQRQDLDKGKEKASDDDEDNMDESGDASEEDETEDTYYEDFDLIFEDCWLYDCHYEVDEVVVEDYEYLLGEETYSWEGLEEACWNHKRGKVVRPKKQNKKKDRYKDKRSKMLTTCKRAATVKTVNGSRRQKQCEKQQLLREHFESQKNNAHRRHNHVYSPPLYAEARQIIQSSSPPHSSSSRPSYTSSSSSSSSSTTSHDAATSSSSSSPVPVYETELTNAISNGQAVQCGLTAQQLNDMLNRDLTPEDYELLLMLDATVKPKTLSQEMIDGFPVHVVQGEGSAWAGEMCTVCMAKYEVDDLVKVLPCEHAFHKECIEQWFSNSSTKCPLDGISLLPDS